MEPESDAGNLLLVVNAAFVTWPALPERKRSGAILEELASRERLAARERRDAFETGLAVWLSGVAGRAGRAPSVT